MAFTIFATSADPTTLNRSRQPQPKRSFSKVLGDPAQEAMQLTRQLQAFLHSHDLARRAIHAAHQVVEEMVSNTANYADDTDTTLDLEVEVGESNIVLSFSDQGRPFDSQRKPVQASRGSIRDPTQPVFKAQTNSLREVNGGGLGLRLVHHAACAIYYRLLPWGNRTVVIIRR